MSDWLPWVGGTLTAIAALLSGYAAVKARKTDDRAATREETQQALDAQSNLLTRYERRIDAQDKEIATLRERIAIVEAKAEDAIAARNEVAAKHTECERRLAALEASINPAGGHHG